MMLILFTSKSERGVFDTSINSPAALLLSRFGAGWRRRLQIVGCTIMVDCFGAVEWMFVLVGSAKQLITRRQKQIPVDIFDLQFLLETLPAASTACI